MNTTLKKGDIILFKTEGDWLGNTIAKLTASDVSHAVILYSENSVIEMIAPGVCINPVTISPGNNAYVMRLKPELNAEPILKAADKYRRAKARYDFPALVILAGVIQLQSATMQRHLLPICNKIILTAAKQLDVLIEKIILRHKEDAMICSQFVYQAYYDCGGDYRLKVENGTMYNSSSNAASPTCLAQLPYGDYAITDELLGTDDIATEQPEELAQMLMEQMEQEPTECLSVKEYPNILPAVHLFQKKIKKISKLLHTDLPFEAMFITPADIAYHTKNLERIASIQVERPEK